MVSVKFNQERERRSVHKYILSIETSLFEGLERKFLQEKYYKDKLDIHMVGCTSAVKTSM